MNLEELKAYAISQVKTFLGSDYDKVSALAFQGGIGRGRFDDLSDIDLLIAFDKEEESKGVIKGEHEIDEKKWSIFHLSFDKVSPKKWSEKLRYVYGFETIIFYDKKGTLAALCKETMLSKEEQIEKTVYRIKKLGNRGITYRGILNEEWRGIYWGDRYDLWLFRGDIYAAQMRLNEASELLVELIYAINALPVPSQKWKHHLVTKLDWTPDNFVQHLQESSMILSMTREDVERRYHLFVVMLTECIEKSISLDLIPENLGEFYSGKFSSHSDNTEN